MLTFYVCSKQQEVRPHFFTTIFLSPFVKRLGATFSQNVHQLSISGKFFSQLYMSYLPIFSPSGINREQHLYNHYRNFKLTNQNFTSQISIMTVVFQLFWTCWQEFQVKNSVRNHQIWNWSLAHACKVQYNCDLILENRIKSHIGQSQTNTTTISLKPTYYST